MTHFKKAICNETFEGWKIEDIFQYVGELGYDGVEINPYKLSEPIDEISFVQRCEIQRSAERAGVEIVGIHSVFKAQQDFFYLNHPDTSVRAKAEEHLKALISLCGDLGGKIMVFGASKYRAIYPGLTYQQAWQYSVEIFKAILHLAEEQEVVLCLEPLSHRLTDFITTVSEAIRMVEEINHTNFKMMIDVRSATDDEMPIPDLIRRSANHLFHFHANDDSGGAPGTGNADYAGIAKALKEIEYNGYLSVEVFDFKPNPETIAIESLETLKKYFD